MRLTAHKIGPLSGQLVCNTYKIYDTSHSYRHFPLTQDTKDSLITRRIDIELVNEV